MIAMTLQLDHPLNTGKTADSALIQNMRGTRTNPLPIWFMRQAGRSLPEYREIRNKIPMLDSCLTPDLAAEITMQPVRRHGVDAAIFFSDIVVPLKLAGLNVEIQSGIGPVIENPIRTENDLDRLSALTDSSMTPIVTAVKELANELGPVPLIGFGGAPFTLASYLIEGGPSKDLPYSREMMKSNPNLWTNILNWCADVTAQFISAQVNAGASALQVFDSWAGRLTKNEYEQFALPYSRNLFSQLSSLKDVSGQAVPRIHFGVGTEKILKEMLSAGATVMGIDEHTELEVANQLMSSAVPLQGNISTKILNSPWSVIEHHIDVIIDSGSAAPGHIVNLGHGVPADTNPDVLTRITDYVHEATS
jgi:uroporphyrinogen decarboxylase